jgi:hypothetical protein
MLTQPQICFLFSFLESNRTIFNRIPTGPPENHDEIICIDEEPKRKSFRDVLRTKGKISKKKKFLFRATGNLLGGTCPICLMEFRLNNNVKYSLIRFRRG